MLKYGFRYKSSKTSPMQKKTWIGNLYLLNLALLFTHEIDSAYWREWILFRIPGGIQVFLVFNFLLLLAALYGFQEAERGSRAGRIFSVVLACAGSFAFTIHTYFIHSGHAEFTLPASRILLWLILAVSLAQAAAVLKHHG